MIPVSLYGADEAELERFYSVLPDLVSDAYEDRPYQETLFAISGENVIQHIEIADNDIKRRVYLVYFSERQGPIICRNDVVIAEFDKILTVSLSTKASSSITSTLSEQVSIS